MSIHLLRDLESLKKKILLMGAKVEEATDLAITALFERRTDLKPVVRQGDMEIDSLEIEIEEDCLKILALHQPVAADLRFVITVLKVNNDLERVGDLAYNIAKRATSLAEDDPISVPADFSRMVEAVRKMLRQSLDALVEQSPELARVVLGRDDEVDRLHKEMFSELQRQMSGDPAKVEQYVRSLSISRNLERIADLATNIAEDVVFLVEGEVIRHRAHLAESS